MIKFKDFVRVNQLVSREHIDEVCDAVKDEYATDEQMSEYAFWMMLYKQAIAEGDY